MDWKKKKKGEEGKMSSKRSILTAMEKTALLLDDEGCTL